jgi:hypothetical protein
MRPEEADEERETKRLEQMLDEGLDDIDAGRIVTGIESRREIDAMFSAVRPR